MSSREQIVFCGVGWRAAIRIGTPDIKVDIVFLKQVVVIIVEELRVERDVMRPAFIIVVFVIMSLSSSLRCPVVLVDLAIDSLRPAASVWNDTAST